MDNLWVFGDSFSCPYSNDDCRNWGDRYIEYKGYEPKIFADLIGEELSLNHINRAKGGADNYTIFERICNNIDDITNDDLIIVGWTNPNRYRIVLEDGSWQTIIPNFFNTNFKISELDYLSIQGVYRNDSKQPMLEIYSWMKILKKIFKKRIVFWGPFLTNQADIICPTDLIEVIPIVTDTKGIVHDYHYDEMTHQKLANLILDFYLKSIAPKKIV